MQFYIYLNATWQAIDVEISPTLVKAKDTTNDSFTCTLKANAIAEPYKPMTQFKIIDDESNTSIMWIINDSVSVFSLNPQTYKHTLSLVQYRYFLTKHIVRNTIFEQPRKDRQNLYLAATSVLVGELGGQSEQYLVEASVSNSKLQVWADEIIVKAPSKIRACVLNIEMYAIMQTSANAYSFQKVNYSDLTNVDAVFDPTFQVRIKDGNTVVATITNIRYYFMLGQKPNLTSVRDTINTYLETHPNATLKAEYYMGSDTQDITQSFVKKGNPSAMTYPKAQSVIMHVNVNLELYNYNFYDVINVLLNQYKLYNYPYGFKRDQLFLMPLPNTDGLYELLQSTYPPDTLTLTQCTFYDALMEIFSFFDAGFKFDENKRIQIEYYNEKLNKITPKMTGYQSSHSDKNYHSGKIAYYQNAVQDVKIKNLPTRSEGIGVPEQTQFSIILPKPIYEINKLNFYVKTTISFGLASSLSFTAPLELDPFLVNKELWTTFDKADFSSLVNIDYQKNYQQTTLFFERGNKGINVSTYYEAAFKQQHAVLEYVLQRAMKRFVGVPNNYSVYFLNYGFTELESLATNWKQQCFDIDFKTTNNGVVKIETLTKKYGGEEIVNQSNGGVDLGKLGLHIYGESLKDGEPTLTAACEIESWENRPVEGDYIEYNGGVWVANVINFTILPNGKQKCNIEFSKNFNALSLRVKTDNEKRLTSISRELAVLSEDTYIDYIYVTDKVKTTTSEDCVLPATVLESMVGQTFNVSKTYTVNNIDFASLYYMETGSTKINVDIPLTVYGSGNCVCFEMQYDDPISAGNILTTESGWFGTNKMFSQSVDYTQNNSGWSEYFIIEFGEYKSTVDYPYWSYYPLIVKEMGGNQYVTLAGGFQLLQYYKKPNEIFALNYEWCFLPYEDEKSDFFIGNPFIVNNSYSNRDKLKKVNFYLCYTQDGDFKYSIMDTKGEGTVDIRELSFNIQVQNDIVELSIICPFDPMVEPTTLDVKTWAIVDDDNNIYFASNHPQTFDNTGSVKIYFYLKNKRM